MPDIDPAKAFALFRAAIPFDQIATQLDCTTEEARASSEARVRQFVHGLTDGPL